MAGYPENPIASPSANYAIKFISIFGKPQKTLVARPLRGGRGLCYPLATKKNNFVWSYNKNPPKNVTTKGGSEALVAGATKKRHLFIFYLQLLFVSLNSVYFVLSSL